MYTTSVPSCLGENLAMPWFPPSRLFSGSKPPQIVANTQQLYFLPKPFSKHIQHSQCVDEIIGNIVRKNAVRFAADKNYEL